MGQQFGIYGEVEFPAKAIARWREMPITDHDIDYARGTDFDTTTVAAVIDEAASFGEQYGQFIDLEQTATSIAIRACLVDDVFGSCVKALVTAFHAAAKVGATGEIRISELPGQPELLVLAKGKATIKTPRNVPADDDELQEALIVRASSIPNKPGKKKKR